jgi:hypothetical protein
MITHVQMTSCDGPAASCTLLLHSAHATPAYTWNIKRILDALNQKHAGPRFVTASARLVSERQACCGHESSCRRTLADPNTRHLLHGTDMYDCCCLAAPTRSHIALRSQRSLFEQLCGTRHILIRLGAHLEIHKARCLPMQLCLASLCSTQSCERHEGVSSRRRETRVLFETSQPTHEAEARDEQAPYETQISKNAH